MNLVWGWPHPGLEYALFCYNLVANLELRQNDGSYYTSTIGENCGLNQTQCVAKFNRSYLPIGKTQEVYFAPWNPNKQTDNVSYNTGLLVNMWLPAAYLIFMVLVTIVYGLRILFGDCVKDSCIGSSRANSEQSVEEKPVYPPTNYASTYQSSSLAYPPNTSYPSNPPPYQSHVDEPLYPPRQVDEPLGPPESYAWVLFSF